MGRLTIDIPEDAHQHLKILVANRGVTIKEYLLEKMSPDFSAAESSQRKLKQLAKEWEERRKDFRLERGDRSLREMIHEDHKW
jgi:hypothetical protein